MESDKEIVESKELSIPTSSRYYDSNSLPPHCVPMDEEIISDGDGHISVRSRKNVSNKIPTSLDFEQSCVHIVAENSIEANRISNNYKFGLKKWKSHVTSRPIEGRSEIVQDLYSDINKIGSVKFSTIRPFNVLYTILFGWWLCLLYIIVGALMGLTVFGIPYAKFCWRLGTYFFFPFGKFVHQVKRKDFVYRIKRKEENSHSDHTNGNGMFTGSDEAQHLLNNSLSSASSQRMSKCCHGFWTRPVSYIWLVLGVIPLGIVHAVLWGISWFFVISIPLAKLNGKTLTTIFFLQPDEVHIGDSGISTMDMKKHHTEIIMYTHQSINIYYYKYTVDGMNIIFVNLLIFVILSIILGYAFDESVINGVTKCILGVLAIIPLTYYIGMGITSISAQTSFAVGALLNATFGSAVEVILFIIMLNKGLQSKQECYQELVKSSLTGAILCSILFIPGVSMVVGGLKYRTQRFNPKSANISASLLFVAVIGVFAPTVFSKLYGSLHCHGCEKLPQESVGQGNSSAYSFLCQQCEQSLAGLHGDSSLYQEHIRPLVYGICLILPFAYFIGLIFTMKTHSDHVFEEFEKQLKDENVSQNSQHSNNDHHGTAQWSIVKSTIILLVSAVAIALCADIISDNIQPLLEETGISEYFIGVTMLSLVSELPEVVNGVQFALQNNVNLGIEIGCSTAIQVCLVQIPILVLANLIYDMNFYIVFNDVHLYAVFFSVIVINYIFQDGKSDYFQGSIVLFIYVLLMLMYFFMLTPDHAKCHSNAGQINNTTPLPFT